MSSLFISSVWAVTPAVPAEAQFRVMLDITRGVQQGCVYQGEQEIRCFPISGGRNQAQTYTNSQGRPVRYCSYTSTGENLKPQLIQYLRESQEFRSGLKYFVAFDEARGVGTHTGDISGYSGACIRLRERDAKFLFDLVKENSELRGQLVLSSRVTYTVIDNTPGRQEKECECVSDYLRYLTIHKERAPQICNGEPYPIELPAYLVPKPLRPRPRPADLMASELAPASTVRPPSRPADLTGNEVIPASATLPAALPK